MDPFFWVSRFHFSGRSKVEITCFVCDFGSQYFFQTQSEDTRLLYQTQLRFITGLELILVSGFALWTTALLVFGGYLLASVVFPTASKYAMGTASFAEYF